jgi:hypothetical protein
MLLRKVRQETLEYVSTPKEEVRSERTSAAEASDALALSNSVVFAKSACVERAIIMRSNLQAASCTNIHNEIRSIVEDFGSPNSRTLFEERFPYNDIFPPPGFQCCPRYRAIPFR